MKSCGACCATDDALVALDMEVDLITELPIFVVGCDGCRKQRYTFTNPKKHAAELRRLGFLTDQAGHCFCRECARDADLVEGVPEEVPEALPARGKRTRRPAAEVPGNGSGAELS